ncbi:MAG: class I SAM-dependent methyltransferase [Gemmatimonadota bacterium]|nr:MAG: class I SAM-dependent methyltransferase [Gemmatimonadota bacterium]
MRNVYRQLAYWRRLQRVSKTRYRHLIQTVYRRRCRTLVEIGTYDGVHAQHMIETAGIFHPISDVEYFGFDLFELLTDDDLEKEFSKKPPSLAEVAQRLEGTGANVGLSVGYTSETLPKFVREKRNSGTAIDFVFIDGGHSIETITSDWSYVRELMNVNTVVLFDDYYSNTEPEVQEVGCRQLVDKLDRREYDVEVLEPEDHFTKEWGILKVRMVRATLRSR